MLSWLFHGSSNQKEEEGTNEKKKGGTKGTLSAACPPHDISILMAPPIHSYHDGRCYVFCLLTSSMGTERDPLHAFILAPRGRGRDRLGQHGVCVQNSGPARAVLWALVCSFPFDWHLLAGRLLGLKNLAGATSGPHPCRSPPLAPLIVDAWKACKHVKVAEREAPKP